jgi:hypothetical protein
MGKKIQKKATRGRPRKQVKPNTKLYRQYKKRKVNKKDKTFKIKVIARKEEIKPKKQIKKKEGIFSHINDATKKKKSQTKTPKKLTIKIKDTKKSHKKMIKGKKEPVNTLINHNIKLVPFCEGDSCKK